MFNLFLLKVPKKGPMIFSSAQQFDYTGNLRSAGDGVKWLSHRSQWSRWKAII
jgi:hypothetical protein